MLVDFLDFAYVKVLLFLWGYGSCHLAKHIFS